MTNTMAKPFPFKTEPLKHQAEDFERFKDLDIIAPLWEMGLGKTKLAIDIAAYKYLKKEINALLVFAPKGCYRVWSDREVDTHMPDCIDYRCERHDSGGSVVDKRKVEGLITTRDKTLDILVMNTEAMSSEGGLNVALRFIKGRKVLCIIDESTDIKNVKAARTKNIYKLRDLTVARGIMSGTPITQSPLDIYAQASFLKKGLLGHNSFFSFKTRYANVIQMRMGTRMFPKIVGYQNLEELQGLIASFASRRTKKECLNLPEKIFMRREVAMTTEQRKAYDELKRFCITQLSSGLVTVQSALVLLGKLHQITGGHVVDELGVAHRLPCNRPAELLSLLSETSEKVIIWCKFHEEVQIIKETIIKAYDNMSYIVAEYTGDTKNRDEQLEAFKAQELCRFLVCTEAGSKGITVNESHTVIYYSVGFSLMVYLQSQDRNHRIGQTHPVTYCHLVTPDTIDDYVIRRLMEKKNLADEVLDNWREMVQ